MSKCKQTRTNTVLILGASLIAAAWLIKGETILQNYALSPKLVNLLLYMPVVAILFILPAVNKNFMRCEYRAWRRIFGK